MGKELQGGAIIMGALGSKSRGGNGMAGKDNEGVIRILVE